MSPLVYDTTRSGWEAYSVENNQWVDDSLRFDRSVTTTTRRTTRKLDVPQLENGISKGGFFLKDGTERFVDITSEPFLPTWQHYPAVPGLVNFNMFSNPNFHDGLEALLETGNAVIGRIWDVSSADTALSESFDVWERDGTFSRDDPASKLFYPVFDSLDAGHKLVGVITAVINWKTHFEEVLPPHATGLIVVLENACGQVYTYSIDGEEAHLLGEGDLHDSKYDYLTESASFAALVNPDDRKIDRFAQVDLNNDFCPYKLTVYPSEDLENDFVTNAAVIYTVCVVLIFVFTGRVFLGYDYFVERRQKMVMKRAVQSRAIVSSLFPAAVRDRLFRNDDSTASRKKNKATGQESHQIFSQ